MKFFEKYSFLVILGLTLIGSFFYFSYIHKLYSSVATYDACMKVAGHIEIDLQVCKLPGKIFVKKNESANNLVLGTSTTVFQNLETVYKNLTYYLDGQKLPMVEGQAIFGATTSKHILFSIVSSIPLTLLPQSETKNYGFFVVRREDSEPHRESFYIGGVMDLNYSFSGLNFAFLDKFATSTVFELDTKTKTLTVSYKDSEGNKKKKLFDLGEDNFIKEIKS